MPDSPAVVTPEILPADRLGQLSTLLNGAAADDLPGLADAHSAFESLLGSLDEANLDAERLEQMKTAASTGAESLEKLILADVEDAQAELNNVRQIAGDLAALFNGESVKRRESAPPTVPIGEVGGIITNESVEPVEEEAPASTAKAVELSEDDLPLLIEFVTEANSHLEQAEQDLLTLEDDPTDVEAISSLFRAFHTIKGVAGFMNLGQVQSLAHATESLLDQAREGKLSLTGDATGIVLESLDLMKELIVELDAAAKSDRRVEHRPEVDSLSKRLSLFVESGGKQLVEDHDTRTTEDRRKQDVPVDGADRRQPDADRRAPRTTGDGTVKVATNRLDSLIDTVGELVIANAMVTRDVTDIAMKDPRLGRNAAQMGKIVRELQDLSMGLRMVPVGNAFRKMTRVVRDVAQKAGKKAELVIVGGDTELDRNVVDALGDPLVHMVRNSVDHGLETPEEREAAGKSPVGRVELRAQHKGGAINIEIADDGKGLNAEKIIAKARKNGIIGEHEQISDADAYRLVFHAGLSTAEKVSDISGRGVGMDVVKRNIESLRGRIDITSEPGKGSTFTIRLPLTLAVIDGLVIRVGPGPNARENDKGQRYILPINSVEQSMRPTPEMLSTVQGRGEVLHVRGELLPLVRLHRLFAVEPKSTVPNEALVVIVHDADRRCCLLVDDLLGQEQVVIKSLGSLGESIGPIKGVSGGAVLGDGTVSLILDVPTLLEIAED